MDTLLLNTFLEDLRALKSCPTTPKYLSTYLKWSVFTTARETLMANPLTFGLLMELENISLVQLNTRTTADLPGLPVSLN